MPSVQQSQGRGGNVKKRNIPFLTPVQPLGLIRKEGGTRLGSKREKEGEREDSEDESEAFSSRTFILPS